MIVTFSREVPTLDTMCFEQCFEKPLRVGFSEKSTILRDGLAAWMYVDGEIAGETYGIAPHALQEKIEDCEPYQDASTLYCYTTAMLKPFRGQGYAWMLMAYFTGMAAQAGFTRIVGHATTDAIIGMRMRLGAKLLKKHEAWYGTKREAYFYEQPL